MMCIVWDWSCSAGPSVAQEGTDLLRVKTHFITQTWRLFLVLWPNNASLKGKVQIIWCMRLSLIVSLLSTVDVSQHAPSLQKPWGVLTHKLSNVLLCIGSATKGNLATYWNQYQFMRYFEYFGHVTLQKTDIIWAKYRSLQTNQTPWAKWLILPCRTGLLLPWSVTLVVSLFEFGVLKG